MGKPLKILVYKAYSPMGSARIWVTAVFCVVSAVFLITTAFAGSFNNSADISDDEAVNVQGSFIYATEYLNPYEEIIEESYFNGDFFDEPSIIVQNSAFVANNSPAVVSPFLASERSGIVIYEVQPGDIPSEIASMFGITTNTLLWANNLTPNSKIKAGQKLTILPVSGVKYTIKKDDTLDAIVKKYKGDVEKTIALNGLPANGNLAVGQDIIIPDGQKPVEYIPVKARTYASYTPEELGPYGDTSHGFPWGQCTWYVAQKRYIPWNGNAKNWLAKAKEYGFEIGTEPKVGAIVSTRESVYGHVAYVEAVGDDTITVSEMSLGRGIKRIRILDQDDWRIRGYIY